ncbi:MAG: hypothetical protein ABR523_11290, partial [Desulfurivibrionaceae bacterium]
LESWDAACYFSISTISNIPSLVRGWGDVVIYFSIALKIQICFRKNNNLCQVNNLFWSLRIKHEDRRKKERNNNSLIAEENLWPGARSIRPAADMVLFRPFRDRPGLPLSTRRFTLFQAAFGIGIDLPGVFRKDPVFQGSGSRAQGGETELFFQVFGHFQAAQHE